jgi:hypothetical protein
MNGALSLEKFCQENSISRATAYREINSSRLEARKIGRKTIVTKQAAQDWLASLPKIGGSPVPAPDGVTA